MSSERFKNYLGNSIVLFSYIVILLLIILLYQTDSSVANIKDIASIFLPVIAAWVGTVIAFYFGKENFEAANRNVKELVDKVNVTDKLKKVHVSDVMILYKDIIKYELEPNKKSDDVLLKDLLEICNKNKIARIPIVDSNHVLADLIHRSLIDLIISEKALNNIPYDEYNKLTVVALKVNPQTSVYLKPQLSIREDATLFDAKSAYDNEPNAQDVFVTKDGGIKEPILGWLTQNEIIKNLKG